MRIERMHIGKYWTVCLMGIMLGYSAMAQSKPPQKPAPKPAATAKTMPDTLKVPKFTTRFGPYNGKLEALPDDLKKLVATELIVTDERGQKWNIVAWRFIWKKKEFNDDWKTGQRKTVISPQIAEFDSTSKLSESWQNELKEYLQSGEELVFERIIVEHPESKRKMMAPDLKVMIK
jgi:hypothetical protein